MEHRHKTRPDVLCRLYVHVSFYQPFKECSRMPTAQYYMPLLVIQPLMHLKGLGA